MRAEFWMSAIKILAIVGLLILGIVIDLGGAPSHDRLGFRYWIDPGPFSQLNDIPGALGRFLAFVCIPSLEFLQYKLSRILPLIPEYSGPFS